MCDIIQKLSVEAAIAYGLVAQLGERTVRIREVRGFDPLRVHQNKKSPSGGFFVLFEGDRIIIAHAGGMCMNQRARW